MQTGLQYKPIRKEKFSTLINDIFQKARAKEITTRLSIHNCRAALSVIKIFKKQVSLSQLSLKSNVGLCDMTTYLDLHKKQLKEGNVFECNPIFSAILLFYYYRTYRTQVPTYKNKDRCYFHLENSIHLRMQYLELLKVIKDQVGSDLAQICKDSKSNTVWAIANLICQMVSKLR